MRPVSFPPLSGNPQTADPKTVAPTEPYPFDSAGEWLRPSRRLRQMRLWEAGLGTLAGLSAGTLAAVASGDLVLVLTVPVLILAAGGVLAGYLARRSRAWGYLERDDDLLVRRGVMFRRISVVPYGRMQTVEVTAGPIERSFRLATVRLHTASAATDARIPGLEGPAATSLRDRLAALGEARAEGL